MSSTPTPISADARVAESQRGDGMIRLARRAPAFRSSVWGEVGALFGRHPEMIFFGDGAPAPELIPADRLREAATVAWADAPAALAYGEIAGYEPLRGLIADRMAARGMDVAPSTIVVTNGSQQGIDLVARLTLDPGDAVVVESPTFIGALQVFAAYEAALVPVPVDEEGMRVEDLERALREAPRPPKLIYTIPTFQNPTGATMSRARREALVALARSRGVPIVEDDPYGELRYDGQPEPPLRALDPEVIYLGTFSKTIAPGLRTGWIAAPSGIVGLLTNARESADISNERITMRTVYHTATGFLDAHVDAVRGVYRARRDALLAGLRAHMPPGVRWVEPAGGFFVWVELPGSRSANDLLPLAAGHGVTYLPGSWFDPAGRQRPDLRLSFSNLDEATIAEGTRRLGQALAVFLKG